MPLSSMTCHLKQLCVAVADDQGTLDSYFISCFLLCKSQTTGAARGTSWGFQIHPPVWSRSKHTCATPDRLSHSSWAVSKPVQKIHRKTDYTAVASVALWSCLQATYRHKINSLVKNISKSKRFLTNLLV